MDQMKIGTFLKTLRKEKGLTQEQLAEHLNVSNRSVSRWETGTNMPDISLLTEIAEFYDVSIPELIDGERKSAEMNEDVKNTAEKMADYAGAEKAAVIKNVRDHSLLGVCALAVLLFLELAVPSGYSRITDILHVYSETLVYVTLILIFMISTGLLHKFEKRQKEINLPKPVLALLGALAAFVVAFLLKYLLGMFIG